MKKRFWLVSFLLFILSSVAVRAADNIGQTLMKSLAPIWNGAMFILVYPLKIPGFPTGLIGPFPVWQIALIYVLAYFLLKSIAQRLPIFKENEASAKWFSVIMAAFLTISFFSFKMNAVLSLAPALLTIIILVIVIIALRHLSIAGSPFGGGGGNPLAGLGTKIGQGLEDTKNRYKAASQLDKVDGMLKNREKKLSGHENRMRKQGAKIDTKIESELKELLSDLDEDGILMQEFRQAEEMIAKNPKLADRLYKIRGRIRDAFIKTDKLIKKIEQDLKNEGAVEGNLENTEAGEVRLENAEKVTEAKAAQADPSEAAAKSQERTVDTQKEAIEMQELQTDRGIRQEDAAEEGALEGAERALAAGNAEQVKATAAQLLQRRRGIGAIRARQKAAAAREQALARTARKGAGRTRRTVGRTARTMRRVARR